MDDKPKPAKDYETGLEILGKYVTRYLFECYDITNTQNTEVVSGSPAIWERGTKDARTILHFLSKGVNVLEVRLLSDDAANEAMCSWLDKCRALRQLDFNSNYITRRTINSVRRVGYLTVSLDKIKKEIFNFHKVVTVQ